MGVNDNLVVRGPELAFKRTFHCIRSILRMFLSSISNHDSFSYFKVRLWWFGADLVKR